VTLGVIVNEAVRVGVGDGPVGVRLGVKDGVAVGGVPVIVKVGVSENVRVAVGPEGVRDGVNVGPVGVRLGLGLIDGVNVGVPAPPGVFVREGVKVGSVPVRVGVEVGMPASRAPTTKYGSVVSLSMTAAYAKTGAEASTTITPFSVAVSGAPATA